MDIREKPNPREVDGKTFFPSLFTEKLSRDAGKVSPKRSVTSPGWRRAPRSTRWSSCETRASLLALLVVATDVNKEIFFITSLSFTENFSSKTFSTYRLSAGTHGGCCGEEKKRDSLEMWTHFRSLINISNKIIKNAHNFQSCEDIPGERERVAKQVQ